MLFSVEKATNRPSPLIDGLDEYLLNSFVGRLTTVKTSDVRFLTYTSGQTVPPTPPSS